MEHLFKPGLPGPLMSPCELREGIASLSRGLFFKEASLEMTLSILTEAAAQMSGVERVGIWALTDDQRELSCLELYERSRQCHTRGEVLSASRYPTYFRALREGRGIAADDPARHPLTFEFAADYLARHRVAAMLSTPIHIRGELQGAFCLEQVGTSEAWSAAHHLFAQAVANLVTLALVEFEAGQARAQALAANERLQAIFDASRDAMLIADGRSGTILDANRQAEMLFGCGRADLIGKHQRAMHPAGAIADESAVKFRQLISGQLLSPVLSEIRRSDGSGQAVEISAEVADISDGRQLILGIFRPI